LLLCCFVLRDRGSDIGNGYRKLVGLSATGAVCSVHAAETDLRRSTTHRLASQRNGAQNARRPTSPQLQVGALALLMPDFQRSVSVAVAVAVAVSVKTMSVPAVCAVAAGACALR